MKERHDHNNFWADKLQDAKLPEVGEAWEAMAALLDREIPSGRACYRGHIKRWSLLLILLLLLIGVCNCPGRRRLYRGALSSDHPVTPASTPVTQLPETPAVPAPTLSPAAQIPTAGSIPTAAPTPASPHRSAPAPAGSRSEAVPGKSLPAAPGKDPGSLFNEAGESPKGSDGSSNDPGGPSSQSIHPVRHRRPERPAENDPAPEFLATQHLPSLHLPSIHLPDLQMPPRSVPQVVAKKINPAKAAAAPPPVEIDKKGWVAGLGLNQFFTVGKQERSDYNSGGTSGGVSDYIPVPMIRYYFGRRWFIQLEAQFNAPQYTNKDLLASETPTAVFSSSSQQVNALYIKKLFYLNVPLSFHYSPVRNLYMGTGLQFSRLSNGVGLFQNKVLTTGTPDSVKSAKIESFKGDSTYKKIRTGEFRFLVDISYNYHKFIIGARYNQSLSRFLDVKISTTQQVTQARNSSLQLYIRYILWDGRRPKKSTPE